VACHTAPAGSNYAVVNVDTRQPNPQTTNGLRAAGPCRMPARCPLRWSPRSRTRPTAPASRTG